ncbi:MAG: hypothetical protein LBV80_02790 [Deltaproteobacteria bacterium]|jgi:hypothetical protein|nr:hypothetical protein [Deltaproteobacteria bacterium]
MSGTIGLGNITSANGMFNITDASGKTTTVDLGTLMAMLQADRTADLDAQINEQMGAIKNRNELLSQMTELLASLRKLKAEGCDDGGANSAQSNVQLTLDGVTKPLKGPGESWASMLGLQSQWTDVIGSRGDKRGDDLTKWNSEWDANIALLKNHLDTMNNDSQMDMIKLQQLMEKRGTAMQEASRVMDSSHQTYASIIRNL